MAEVRGSMAEGSGAIYAGDDNFRLRKNGGTIRLHLSRDIIRERANYVAVDLDLADFAHALAMVAAGEV